MKICDVCFDLMEASEPHICPPVDDRYDSADLGVINLIPYSERP